MSITDISDGVRCEHYPSSPSLSGLASPRLPSKLRGEAFTFLPNWRSKWSGSTIWENRNPQSNGGEQKNEVENKNTRFRPRNRKPGAQFKPSVCTDNWTLHTRPRRNQSRRRPYH